ncbi:MAG: Na+/H+ antiporter subunit E [Proteobacteria bacterium]|nr:Na+/H+ antiporter subunit E [Pseudomonadota bacterium]
MTLALGLGLVWALWSGHAEPLMIGFGVVSCALVLWLSWRLDVIDPKTGPYRIGWRFAVYVAWLLWEMAGWSAHVGRVVLTPRLAIRPRLLWVPASELRQLDHAHAGHAFAGCQRRDDRGARAHRAQRGRPGTGRDGPAGGGAGAARRGGAVMFAAAAIAVLITMALALLRALRGPTVYDRILALNMFGTKTVLLIAVAGFLTGRPEWLDLALLYALIGFVLRNTKYRGLGADEGGTP